jgi:hypothetical protein
MKLDLSHVPPLFNGDTLKIILHSGNLPPEVAVNDQPIDNKDTQMSNVKVNHTPGLATSIEVLSEQTIDRGGNFRTRCVEEAVIPGHPESFDIVGLTRGELELIIGLVGITSGPYNDRKDATAVYQLYERLHDALPGTESRTFTGASGRKYVFEDLPVVKLVPVR